jgi:hypothetical protein
MRIDVSEYVAECQKIQTYCEQQRRDLASVQRSLENFSADIQRNFTGKTGDSILAYIDEVIDPILEKMAELEEDLVDIMDIMHEDMMTNFGANGIIDVSYLSGEYLQHFYLYAEDISQHLYEVNQIARSISDIIELPQVSEEQSREATRQMKAEVDKVTNLMLETDRKWCQLLTPIDEQLQEIKTMLSTIEGGSFSPETYERGTARFFSLDHLPPEIRQMYRAGSLSRDDIIKLSAIATPEVMSPDLWQVFGEGISRFGVSFIDAFQHFLLPAGALAVADGPLPVGDLIAGGLIIVGVIVALVWAGYQLTVKKEYRKAKKRKGQKTGTDIPSWARGQRPYVGENGKKFAKRLCDERYGEGNYPIGAGSEFNQLKKHGDRDFE